MPTPKPSRKGFISTFAGMDKLGAKLDASTFTSVFNRIYLASKFTKYLSDSLKSIPSWVAKPKALSYFTFFTVDPALAL